MMIFNWVYGIDWQAIAVILAILGALAFLAHQKRRKKSQACGSSSCGCVKKKG